ncbi:hypothetical protein VIGAN_04378500 [Vigna angularis var. angularis]|uniref:Uncharacterized protein n=1 Tax=Vigna angularis var. angularis TaxID=157739 RepID=A0A0S3RZZ1_PHAAN|nr:hypothetical protein VIGAN_04378500 [Vigna angularis var. angularis]
MVIMKKPQCHAFWVLTHTTPVTPVIAPTVELSKSQLKKLARAFASVGSFSSNWSAPNAVMDPLTPPIPNANKHSDV